MCGWLPLRIVHLFWYPVHCWWKLTSTRSNPTPTVSSVLSLSSSLCRWYRWTVTEMYFWWAGILTDQVPYTSMMNAWEIMSWLMWYGKERMIMLLFSLMRKLPLAIRMGLCRPTTITTKQKHVMRMGTSKCRKLRKWPLSLHLGPLTPSPCRATSSSSIVSTLIWCCINW